MLQLQIWLSNIKTFVTDEWRLVVFCSHEQAGKFAEYLRGPTVPTCHAVRELTWRKTDGKGRDEPGPGGLKFTSNYESVIWAKFGPALTEKVHGQEAALGETDFPFGRSSIPQSAKDNLRLLCFSAQRIRAQDRLVRRIMSKGIEKTIIANEYLNIHMISFKTST
jgi:hypothetical protein